MTDPAERRTRVDSKAVRRQGETGAAIGGRKYYHPHLERVIAELAASPYMARGGQPVALARSYGALPLHTTQLFVKAATYHFSRVRRKFKESIPHASAPRPRTERGASAGLSQGALGAALSRLSVAELNLERTVKKISAVLDDTKMLPPRQRAENRVTSSPIDRNPSSALARIADSSDRLTLQSGSSDQRPASSSMTCAARRKLEESVALDAVIAREESATEGISHARVELPIDAGKGRTKRRKKCRRKSS